MRYLDIVEKSKYKDFYKDLLNYIFDKFELLASEEDEDYCFELLKWDLSTGIENGYSLEMQLSLAKYVFNKELDIEKIQNEEERKYLEAILEKYSERHFKNP